MISCFKRIDIIPFFLLYVLIWFTQSSISQENSGDSLLYTQHRSEIFLKDSIHYSKYIEASDELARLGLFKQAISILNDLVNHDKNAEKWSEKSEQSDHITVSQPLIDYIIQIGADYLKFDKAESSHNRAEIIDPHSLDDKQIYGSFTLRVKPFQSKPIFFTPEIKLSNQQAYASLQNLILALDSLLLFETELEVQKQFWHEEYDTNVTTTGNRELLISERDFFGTKKLPSDMCQVIASLGVTNRYRESLLKFNIPIRINSKRYRKNEVPFISFIDYTIVPEIELTSRDFSKGVRLRFESNYRDYDAIDYDGTTKDTSDKILIRPDVIFTAYKKKVTNEIEICYSYEHYIDAQYLKTWRQFMVYSNNVKKMTDFLEGNFSITYTYENSLRSCMLTDSTINNIHQNPFTMQNDTIWNKNIQSKEYYVKGNIVNIAPELIFEVKEYIKLGCAISFNETWYPISKISTVDFIAESVRSFVPEIWCGVEKAGFVVRNRLSYCHTQSKNPGVYDYDLKKSARFSIDGNAKFSQYLSVFAVVDCETSYYDKQNNPQNNISLSAGSIINF